LKGPFLSWIILQALERLVVRQRYILAVIVAVALAIALPQAAEAG